MYGGKSRFAALWWCRRDQAITRKVLRPLAKFLGASYQSGSSVPDVEQADLHYVVVIARGSSSITYARYKRAMRAVPRAQTAVLWLRTERYCSIAFRKSSAVVNWWESRFDDENDANWVLARLRDVIAFRSDVPQLTRRVPAWFMDVVGESRPYPLSRVPEGKEWATSQALAQKDGELFADLSQLWSRSAVRDRPLLRHFAVFPPAPSRPALPRGYSDFIRMQDLRRIPLCIRWLLLWIECDSGLNTVSIEAMQAILVLLWQGHVSGIDMVNLRWLFRWRLGKVSLSHLTSRLLIRSTDDTAVVETLWGTRPTNWRVEWHPLDAVKEVIAAEEEEEEGESSSLQVTVFDVTNVMTTPESTSKTYKILGNKHSPDRSRTRTLIALLYRYLQLIDRSEQCWRHPVPSSIDEVRHVLEGLQKERMASAQAYKQVADILSKLRAFPLEEVALLKTHISGSRREKTAAAAATAAAVAVDAVLGVDARELANVGIGKSRSIIEAFSVV